MQIPDLGLFLEKIITLLNLYLVLLLEQSIVHDTPPVVQRRAAAKKISSSQYEIVFLRLGRPVTTILAKNRGRLTSMANRSHETKPECNVSF